VASIQFVIAGFASGIIGGLFGIGGAAILIPILVYFFKFAQQQAQGTAVVALLPPIGLLAAIQYYRAGFVDVRVAAFVAAGFFVGAWFGAFGAVRISNAALQRGFAIFLILVGLRMLMRAR
jgi:uncharacterized membrane protein YfcA